MRVLVLAGTSDANALIGELVARGVDVVASLAGRTSAPRPLPCPTRVGGFGGVDGLVDELRERGVTALVDATHPFADEMPRHASEASARVGIPHLRLVRDPWTAREGDRWIEVDDVPAAAARLRALGSERALLTLGRQELDRFRDLTGIELVVRSVDEPPAGPWAAVILRRGSFDYDDERALLEHHRIDTVVTRNSGGPTSKLDAARDVGARMVIVRRPPALEAPTVTDVAGAVEWVLSLGR